MSKRIYVTQPSMPSLDDYVDLLKDIWKSKWLTNDGKYHKLFEKELKKYLGVSQCNLFSSGTLALLIGLKALRITGEVITTPYSFVATSHVLKWNGIIPVFCDIDPETCNIDANKIESLISPDTTAILPVHIYGNPCEVDTIQEISDKYGLKVIYDTAHGFGVKINGETICNFGDISVLSFHATKLFTTFEGGAIICNDEHLKKRIDFLKNFGFAGETTVIGVGINAKMNELQAAFGLLQLKIVEKEIENRKLIAERYRKNLSGIEGLKIFYDIPNVDHNYSYFPILINGKVFGMSREKIYNVLKDNGIHARRYFYPLISHFPPYRSLPSARSSNLPVAERISQEILCLPIYGNLSTNYVDMICDIIIGER